MKNEMLIVNSGYLGTGEPVKNEPTLNGVPKLLPIEIAEEEETTVKTNRCPDCVVPLYPNGVELKSK